MALAARLRSAAARIALLPRVAAADPGFGNPRIGAPEGLRGFATETKPTEAKIKVPLSLFGGTGNYATALFIAASKANILDKVESEVLDVVEASKRSPKFSQFIKDPTVPREKRVKAINEIFADAGLTTVTKNFLAVLADNGRLKFLERITKRFVELTMEHRGEIRVRVTSVIPLPAAEEKDLAQTLKDILGKENVIIEQKVDPSILGGLVIEFGQKLIDMSIKTRAMQMERFLMEPLDFEKL